MYMGAPIGKVDMGRERVDGGGIGANWVTVLVRTNRVVYTLRGCPHEGMVEALEGESRANM